MRVLIDTNVIIDELTKRRPYNDVSQYVFTHSAMKTCNMFLGANQITDIYYLVNKYYRDKVKSSNHVNKIMRLFKVLDILEMDCIAALNSSVADFEDAVMESVAYRNDCDFIVTRNIKDFANSRVKAITPEEFVLLVEA